MKKVIIMGAGPAGLTAAYEAVMKSNDLKPIVYEMDTYMGGISKTVNYKENRMDMGGHRFFSKSDVVMNWWQNILPIYDNTNGQLEISYQGKKRVLESSSTGVESDKNIFLVRNRLSRIYYLRNFFSYPVSLNLETIKNLGLWRIFKIGFYYSLAVAFPIKPEKNLEDFLINRFGKELYLTFFKSYTEKVWGIECNKISAEWGAQRIKGLSITKTILHILKSVLPKKKDLSQKNIETSLIEKFLYPKLGPGQMWEVVSDKIKEKGGEIYTKKQVVGIERNGEKIVSISVKDLETGQTEKVVGDYFISTLPIKELVNNLSPKLETEVAEVANGLMYRDFITVGLLLSDLKIKNRDGSNVLDNWIYIQEPDVKLGRLQIFNNWSPYLVSDQKNTWIGLEYFCTEGDELWNKSDEEFKKFAIKELAKIDIIDESKVLDSTIVRVKKAYPAYFGTYDKFDVIKDRFNKFENLFLVGRNGMHKYNNQDHSMLTAMTAIGNIISGNLDKENIWSINTEQEYHEKK